MGEEKPGNHVTKCNTKKEKLFHENVHAEGRTSPVRMGNGRVLVDGADDTNGESRTKREKPTRTVESLVRKQKSPNRGSSVRPQLSCSPRQPHTIVNNFMEVTEESPRIRNYQIKSVKRGVPVITPTDATVQRIVVEKKDLRITPYWICQKQKENTKRTAAAWIFSVFVTFVSVVCPLTSFASDVGFYVTCSDHYNHTAELLTEVRRQNGNEAKSELENSPFAKNNERKSEITFPRTAEYAQGVKIVVDDSSETRPAPLKARQKRAIQRHPSQINLARFVDSRDGKHRRRIIPMSNKNEHAKIPSQPCDHVRENVKAEDANYLKTYDAYVLLRQPDHSPKNRWPSQDVAQSNRRVLTSSAREDTRQTNFEMETREANESACDSPGKVIAYMLTEKAATELEAHRHVTIDIFEPVFILGSFPSLILCILTRLVVLITAHKNFLSAYVINMACMPLQLVTGALSVHSASYHLGKTGFECWHCAHEGDCSGMDPLWWLEDGVTKSLLVSIATKILDGIAGGLVLFIVIIRLLWSRGGHATFWWNLLRWLVICAAFFFCVTVSPILVITPALGVMRLEFMELATPFPGLDGLSFSLMALMGFGLAAWSLSFAVLFVYLCYSMYMYCRKRTIDR